MKYRAMKNINSKVIILLSDIYKKFKISLLYSLLPAFIIICCLPCNSFAVAEYKFAVGDTVDDLGSGCRIVTSISTNHLWTGSSLTTFNTWSLWYFQNGYFVERQFDEIIGSQLWFYEIKYYTSPSTECLTCVPERSGANSECGVDNWNWTDESNCEYKCIIPLVCDTVDIASAVLQCGNDNYTFFEMPGPDAEHPDCGWRCNDLDCNADYEELKNFCAYGVSSFDWTTCNGTCRSCYPDARDDVKEICQNRGGVAKFTCEIVDGEIAEQRKVDIKYLCYLENPDVPNGESSPLVDLPGETTDGIPPPGSDPNNPTTDPNDPNNQPVGDPVDSPNATDVGKVIKRLEAINANVGTAVDQNNSQIGQLNTIISNTDTTAKNTQTIAKNLGVIQDEIRFNTLSNKENSNHISSAVTAGASKIDLSINDLKKSNDSGFDDIVGAINNQDNLDFSQLATSNPVPTLTGNEFNSYLPTDNDYTEYDDNTTLASEQAATFAEENLVIDPADCPINAKVTATGDPCLNGDIRLRGQLIPVSICFNRPWMLQGYAIMKILMIGLAYLQTAILLNKAIIR